MVRNVMDLDLAWINSIDISDEIVTNAIATAKLADKSVLDEYSSVKWLAKALTFLDLSLLFGNETPDAIHKLCQKAKSPVKESPKLPKDTKLSCAAVCVYPARIKDAIKSLEKIGAKDSVVVASVAAGFPSGQFPLHTRLAEIHYAVSLGVPEVDVVIDRSLVLQGLWSELYTELVEMRKACGNTCMKVILSVTECGSYTNIFKASVVAMLAGADFIKSGTGKEVVTMTIREGMVMCLAVKAFYTNTGIKVGLKPAGGVRTVENLASWLVMVKNTVGEDWLSPELFRIGTSGASALIDNADAAINQ